MGTPASPVVLKQKNEQVKSQSVKDQIMTPFHFKHFLCKWNTKYNLMSTLGRH